MQNWTKRIEKLITVDLLLFDQFSNHCLANCVEPLRAANALSGQRLYRWRFFTPNGQPVTSSSGLPILPTGDLKTSAPGDYFYVISSYRYRKYDTPVTSKLLIATARRARRVFGFDTGSWLMASAGLLDGRRATIHWDEFNTFRERFLQVDAVRARYCNDGNRTTCSGAMASFDLALELIAQDNGRALQLDVAALLMHDTAIGYTPQISAGDESVRKTLVIMRENIESPLPITAIARRVAVHEKQLQRAFLADLGAPPGKIYKHIRLSMARHLLVGSRLNLSEIAVRTGYENTSSLARAFRQRFGTSPLQFRLQQAYSAA